jgi:putative transposase
LYFGTWPKGSGQTLVFRDSELRRTRNESVRKSFAELAPLVPARRLGEMPRAVRIDLPDATHHIAALAVEREVAFRENGDRRRFLAQLEKVVATYEWRCRSYCLMGTHFHLIVHTVKPNLSRGIQHLCGTYAQWFNWKYGRRGHLFARRFASRHIKADSHLLAAHRYVALNPVRAGLCREPEQWPWSSCRSLAGLGPPLDFLDVEGALAMFETASASPHDAFRDFVKDGVTAPSATVMSEQDGV